MVASNQDNRGILLIGSFPPPYGGVTIHIQRLVESLNKQGISSIVFDPVKFLRSVKQFSFREIWSDIKVVFHNNFPICHIHTSGLNLAKITISVLFLRCLNYRIIVTFHSLRDNIYCYGSLKRALAKIIFRHSSHCIVVSSQISDKIQILCDPDKVSVIPAFMPPTVKQKDIDEIPSAIWDFIDRHAPIISSNAYKITFFNGQDLYGIDMCVDLCANLKENYPNVGFIFSLPTIGDESYFEILKQRILSKDIENNFLFITEKCSFYPILMKSQVFVRPTNTDGDSVSIREALYFKVPVVTSDVVNRPMGSILFINRDIEDFTRKTLDLLNNYYYYKLHLPNYHEDNFEKIFDIYQLYLGERS